MTRPHRPELDFSGERVVLAAELYFAGQTKKILCTGTQYPPKEDWDLHPAEEAREILVRLKVPASAIEIITGDNTYEEAQNLRKRFGGENEGRRVGLLTSAYHLPRALRLTKKNGLTFEPIPANFLTGARPPDMGNLVPNVGNLQSCCIATREVLARLVSR